MMAIRRWSINSSVTEGSTHGDIGAVPGREGRLFKGPVGEKG